MPDQRKVMNFTDDLLFNEILPCLDRTGIACLMVVNKEMIGRVYDPLHRAAWLRLLDHKHRVPPILEKHPGLCLLRLAVPKTCLLCTRRTTRRHVFFDLPVCLDCERNDPGWCCVSRAAAVRDWKVSRRRLESLEYREARNPVFPSRAPMRLYLLSEIQKTL
ncbi:hypothetical protein EBZ80_02205 [bacterium]|nr:hypothetical protein [bacterium]